MAGRSGCLSSVPASLGPSFPTGGNLKLECVTQKGNSKWVETANASAPDADIFPGRKARIKNYCTNTSSIQYMHALLHIVVHTTKPHTTLLLYPVRGLCTGHERTTRTALWRHGCSFLPGIQRACQHRRISANKTANLCRVREGSMSRNWRDRKTGRSRKSNRTGRHCKASSAIALSLFTYYAAALAVFSFYVLICHLLTAAVLVPFRDRSLPRSLFLFACFSARRMVLLPCW
jgi:hypothetical protein